MIPAEISAWMEAALRALVAAAVVWAGLRALRVTNVVVEKAAWALVLFSALALPLVPVSFGLPGVDRVAGSARDTWRSARHWGSDAFATRPAVVVQSTPPQTARVAESAALPGVSLADASYAAEPVPASTPTAQQAPAQQWKLPGWVLAAAGCAYPGVASALLLRLLFGLLAALRLWRGSQPVPAAVAAGARVRASNRLASPVTIGSAVLLPASYTGWSQQKLRVVLAHEQSHIRQGDFYLQLLAGLYTALFWPSPLGWWLKHKLCELGEAISDRAGLEQAASRSSYAQLLLEFAALPRPTLLGVAMARNCRLSDRIERLLNESSFRLAFAGGRRMLVAVLVVPVALMAATALVRVEAATPVQDAVQAQSPQAAVMPDQPPPPPAPDANTPPPPPMQPGQPPQGWREGVPLPPPADQPGGPGFGPVSDDRRGPQMGPNGGPAMGRDPGQMGAGGPQPGMNRPDERDFGQPFGPHGEPYAIIGDGKGQPGSGPWIAADQLEKARKLAHGHFLWYEHEGKSYIVDDAAIVAELEAARESMEVSMDDLRKQMRALGDQQREEARKTMEQARQLRENAGVKVPDMTAELADLNKALETLKAKQGSTISPGELGEIERKLGEAQRTLGEAQGHAFGPGGIGVLPPHFNELMGRNAEQMRKLGEQLGRLAQENDEKTRALIGDSLKNGKAKPVN